MNFVMAQRWKHFFQIGLVVLSACGVFQAQAQTPTFSRKAACDELHHLTQDKELT